MKEKSMSRRILIAIVLIVSAGAAYAGQLYTLTGVGGQTWVATVNPVTGTVTPIINTGAGTALVSNSVTIDPVGGRIFFKTPSQQLYIVNTRTSSVTTVPLLTCCTVYAYDTGTQQLYGVVSGPGPSILVQRIDLVTGATTTVATVNASGVASVQATIDPETHRLFFTGGNETLFVVNLQSGSSTSVPLDPCCPGLIYDTSADMLIGLGSTVVSINPATGAMTPLVVTDSPGIVLDTAGFDPVTVTVFFLGGNGRLYSVNIPQGTFSSAPLSMPASAFLFASHVHDTPAAGGIALLSLLIALAAVAWLRLAPGS